MGISSAVTVGEAVYVVDLGYGWGQQYRDAGLGGSGVFEGLERLRGVFLTHLHSDHVIDLAALAIWAPLQGLGRGDVRAVPVYGPGERTGPIEVRRPGPAPLFVGSPDDAGGLVPGTVQTVREIVHAFRADLNPRFAMTAVPEPDRVIEVHDLELPAEMGGNDVPVATPSVTPWRVHEDDRVRVTATLVDHGEVFPAFAFRFDCDEGAVVISGDTRADTNGNLQRLAAGADVLAHEVYDKDALAQRLHPPGPPYPPPVAGLLEAFEVVHTSTDEVGRVADECGVSTLVLHHYVPADAPEAVWAKVAGTFAGELIVGHDLQVVTLG
jgi:ribonuclease BN (tRNA processing enzyme)